MKRLQIDTKVLILLSWLLFPGQLPAGIDSNRISHKTGGGAAVTNLDGAKGLEIDRLQQALAAGKVEREAINDQNRELHSRMKDLESRILELRTRALDQEKSVHKRDIR